MYFGGIHNPKEFFTSNAPYAWSFLMDGTSDLVLSAELMCKQLNGKPASFSGDPNMQSEKRKFGGIFYTAYAIFAGDPVFITINLLATTNTLVLLLLKLRYR